MAQFNSQFFSQSLMRTAGFTILIPNDVSDFIKKGNGHYNRDTKSLFLLHGFTGDGSDWLTFGNARELSGRYNLAIVLPSGENSFYVDTEKTGGKFGTYIGEELVDYTRKTFGLSHKREDTFIAGLSMGGFGALRNGLKYPETFSKIAALSSALITNNVKVMKRGFSNDLANYAYYVSVFGDPGKLDLSDSNPEKLIRDIRTGGLEAPSIYMACGKDDFLINENRAFRKYLEQNGIKHSYVEEDGSHDWLFWNKYIGPAIEWMLR